MKLAALLLLSATSVAAAPFGFVRQSNTIYFSGGESPLNWHGRSMFHDIDLETAGHASRLPRWLRNSEVGARITYSAVRQARSWFGYKYGDPNDSVRSEWLDLFARREAPALLLGVRPYAEFGTGPMWSNRRIPAATSRLNFNSQATAGVVLFPSSRLPVRFGYRFAHISNGGLTHRNPGLEVSSLLIGIEWMRHRDREPAISRANIPGR